MSDSTQTRHATGFALHREGARRCGDCAWSYLGGPGPRVLRCLQAASGRHGPRVAADAPACERHEPRFGDEACGACGACCREGFHLVQLGAREPLRRSHPHLVVRDGHGYHVPRPDGRCLALCGDCGTAGGYRCTVYALRPRACADFAVAGEACLIARRRVGLSR